MCEDNDEVKMEWSEIKCNECGRLVGYAHEDGMLEEVVCITCNSSTKADLLQKKNMVQVLQQKNNDLQFEMDEVNKENYQQKLQLQELQKAMEAKQSGRRGGFNFDDLGDFKKFFM